MASTPAFLSRWKPRTRPLLFSAGEEYYRPFTIHQLRTTESAKKEVCFMSGTTATGVVKYLVETVCTGETVLVDLNYLPELSSSSVDKSGLTLCGVTLSWSTTCDGAAGADVPGPCVMGSRHNEVECDAENANPVDSEAWRTHLAESMKRMER